MNAKTSDTTIFVTLAATVPVLVLHLGVGLLRMKSKRRRGVRAFRKALVRGGIDHETAKRFAEEYEAIGRLRTYLPDGGLLRLPFSS